MITIKNKKEIEFMKLSGSIAIGAIYEVKKHLAPGVTTKFLNDIADKYIRSKGAIPSFLGYGGFSGSVCLSINEEIIHGIPSKDKILKEGDIISIDAGAYINGYHGDCARTYGIGEIKDEAKKLIEVTKQSFYEGIKVAINGNRIGDIGYNIEKYVTENGYGLVREYTGHALGKALHEDPAVPNYGKKGRGTRLVSGMTLAIEPMVMTGSEDITLLPDKWTVITRDKGLSAHYENSILITDNEPLILTKLV